MSENPRVEAGAPRSAIWRRLAEAIVKDLFVNGAGEQADRLVLAADGPPQRDLGGWGRLPAIDRIETALRAGAEALAPPAPDWQPIETAPQAQQVWAWDDRRGSNPAMCVDGVWLITYDDAEIHPTHWLPLPLPPRAEAREARSVENVQEKNDGVSR